MTKSINYSFAIGVTAQSLRNKENREAVAGDSLG